MSPTLDAVSSALHRHLGILCALASCTSFALMDLFAQYLLVTDPIDIVSLIFIRMTFSLFVSYAYLYSTSQSDLPFGPRQHRWILALRSILHYFVLMGFFIAIRHLTVSDALTIFQLRPFLLGFFSAIFLDEPVNTVQKIAAGISVFGEILLAKPTMLFSTAPPSEIIKSGPESITHSTPTQHFTSFGIIVLLLFFISFDLIAIRRLRGEVHAFLILALCSLAAVIITPIVLLITRQPLILPSSATGWFLLGIVQVCHMYDPTDAQILGVMTQVLLAESLKRETANVMALVSQFQVVPGAICEYLLFGSRFDALSGAGALLTTLAGAWAILQRPQEDQPTLPTARDEGHLMSEMPLLEADDSEEEAKEPTSS